MYTAHLVDMSAVFFRYYFAPSPSVVNDDGYDISALISSVRWLNQARFLDANKVVIAFDESLGSGFRHEIDEDYKANRAEPTPEIIFQLACLQQIAGFLGFTVLKSEIYEADDLIASACKTLADHEIIIHSRDKDLRQLLSESVVMEDVQTKKLNTVESLLDETGLQPEQIPSYLALMGDSSDNIIGVPSVGDKTARSLLAQYRTWPELLAHATEYETLEGIRGGKRIAGLVEEYQELVLHNLALTRLHADVDIDGELAATELFDETQFQALEIFCEQMELDEPLSKILNQIEEYLK